MNHRIASMGILTALAVVLGTINMPFPMFPFLQFDLAYVPILIGMFKFGRIFGIASLTVYSILFELLFGKGIFIGPLMHITAGTIFIVTSGAVYFRNRSRKGAMLCLAAGTLAQTVLMVPMNYLATFVPYPYGIGTILGDLTMKYVLVGSPIFNLILCVVNSLLTFHLYKRVSPLINGSPEAVLGIKDSPRG